MFLGGLQTHVRGLVSQQTKIDVILGLPFKGSFYGGL